MADEQQGRRESGEPGTSDEPVMGAPPGRDPDFELHDEIGKEAKRIATHPRDEAKRLGAELAEGESESTPLIALSVVGFGAAVVVAFVIALVLVVVYLM